MAAPYTNQLINRVRQDIAYSQARNARVAALGRTLQSMPMPSNSSLPAGMSRTALGPTFKGQGGNMLTTIKTPWGSSVTVDAAHAGTFAKLFQGLNALGYHPKSVGGYNYRNIAGTNTLSKHAYGLAVDLDPQQNRGGRLGGGGTRYGYFDAGSVMKLAKSLGMSWGASFGNPDPMHFSFGEG
jgi:D-alanyl-D-alanine carboxypeptidase